MWKKYSLLLLALALVFSLSLSACSSQGNKESSDAESQSTEASSTEEGKLSKAEIAESFAVAALSCEKEGIKAYVHEDMQEAFLEIYGTNEVVFANVKAEAIEEIELYQEAVEHYISTISRDYGAKINIEVLTSFTVNFVGEYNGKEYSGSMTVLVAEVAGENYVVSAEMDAIEDAFYEDNFPDGDFYYDMHGEE